MGNEEEERFECFLGKKGEWEARRMATEFVGREVRGAGGRWVKKAGEESS